MDVPAVLALMAVVDTLVADGDEQLPEMLGAHETRYDLRAELPHAVVGAVRVRSTRP